MKLIITNLINKLFRFEDSKYKNRLVTYVYDYILEQRNKRHKVNQSTLLIRYSEISSELQRRFHVAIESTALLHDVLTLAKAKLFYDRRIRVMLDDKTCIVAKDLAK